MYISVHSARRRGRFIAPVFQSKPNGFNVAKWYETQPILCNYVGAIQWIAISTMGICNAIWWVFVDAGTINRPLRLRNGRGKIYQQTTTYGLFIIQNVYQRTHRNIHFLRKYIATCTPQGVGADSSRPFFNPNQMVLIWRNDAKRNAISWLFGHTATINRQKHLRNKAIKKRKRV